MPDHTPEALTLYRRLDPICDRFEQAWRSDAPPRLEEYLVSAEGPERSWLLRELLLVELAYRIRRGEQPRLSDYAERFPEQRAVVDATFAEVKLRDPAPPPAEESLADTTLAADVASGPTLTCRPPVELQGYEMLAELGRGGMGVVYKARHLALNRIVAVKMIRASHLEDPEQRVRFRREAEAIARVQHPNIVQIHEIGEHQGQPYFSLEFVGGGTLAQRLATAPLPARDAAGLVRLLAWAVRAAHDKGVVHRDLKPANILLQGLTIPAPRPPESPGANDRGDQRPPAKTNFPDWGSTASSGLGLGISGAHLIPKIADFGLAVLLDQKAQSLTGAIVGTPSYMAPEQATARPGTIGPLCDIYALGAILYEALTGRPPFEGASLLDTLDQVKTQEPVPPRQLQPKVPRDLETICLKCLRKEPHSRYTSARALADDLGRFLGGRPIHARPVRTWERSLKWVRRRPALAGLLAVAALALVMGLGGGIWVVQKRTATAQAVTAALQESEILQAQGHWSEGLAVVLRAEELLDQGLFESRALRQRIDTLRADHRFGLALEQAPFRMAEAQLERSLVDPQQGRAAYARAFAAYGIVANTTNPDEAGAQIRSCPALLREQIVMALDHWLELVGPDGPPEELRWLRRLVEAADPDDPWRSQLRQARLEGDLETLKQLAAREDAARQPPSTVRLLAGALRFHEESKAAIDLLRRAQRHSPDALWINYHLAHDSFRRGPPAWDDALRFFTAALALRPGNANLHYRVGYILRHKGALDDAVAAFRRTIELEPDHGHAYANLGFVFLLKGELDEAIPALRKGVSLAPQYVTAHVNLGIALRQKGQVEEAVTVYQEALKIWPQSAPFHNHLGLALQEKGDRAGAIAAYRQAVSLDPDHGQAHCNLGLQLQEEGEFTEALDLLRRGNALGALDPSWRLPSAAWVREAERLVELEKRLPAILSGEVELTEAAALVEFADLCRRKKHFAAAARLYRDGFRLQPQLAVSRRGRAAGAAALAAAGQGSDAGPLSKQDRARWRQQALEWLQAELARSKGRLEASAPGTLRPVQGMLQGWQRNPELALVRDRASLAALPEAEREAWSRFWAEVEDVLRTGQPVVQRP
jgi:serine/threonine-protein kinase